MKLNWINIVENSIQLILIFVGLGIYTSMVLKPIVVEAIRQETTSIVQETTNKFKKTGVVSNTSIPTATSNLNSDTGCIPLVELSKGEQRRLKKKGLIE